MAAGKGESAPAEGPPGQSSFFVAFRVLPAERRDGIETVYRFCRLADDAVDLAPDAESGAAGLEAVTEQLERVYAGRPADGEEEHLLEVIRRYELPRGPFDDLLEGVSWDLDRRRYRTTAELRGYCYRVASTVGLLCVRIFGCREDSCDRYAEELGIALQWTNILRDVGVDLAAGRVYLPQDALRAHGLSEEDLRRADGSSRNRLTMLIRSEAAYARERYAEAERLLPATERPKVLAGEIMAGVYRRLLVKVERAGDAVLDRRLRVSDLRRGCIAAGLLLRRRVWPLRRGVA